MIFFAYVMSMVIAVKLKERGKCSFFISNPYAVLRLSLGNAMQQTPTLKVLLSPILAVCMFTLYFQFIYVACQLEKHAKDCLERTLLFIA